MKSKTLKEHFWQNDVLCANSNWYCIIDHYVLQLFLKSIDLCIIQYTVAPNAKLIYFMYIFVRFVHFLDIDCPIVAR